MHVSARYKNARMTPRKVRQLREVVLGMPVAQAQAQLQWQSGKAARLLAKVLASAVANARDAYDMEPDNLRVATVEVGDGIKFKRYMPASRGSAHRYVKRASHIRVAVEEIEASTKERKPKAAVIETVTAEELAKERDQLREPVAETDEKPVEPAVADEAQMEAHTKKQMLQQGGDRKKGRRRESK